MTRITSTGNLLAAAGTGTKTDESRRKWWKHLISKGTYLPSSSVSNAWEELLIRVLSKMTLLHCSFWLLAWHSLCKFLLLRSCLCILAGINGVFLFLFYCWFDASHHLSVSWLFLLVFTFCWQAVWSESAVFCWSEFDSCIVFLWAGVFALFLINVVLLLCTVTALICFSLTIRGPWVFLVVAFVVVSWMGSSNGGHVCAWVYGRTSPPHLTVPCLCFLLVSGEQNPLWEKV